MVDKMGAPSVQNNDILRFLLERSLFTSRQFEMISKRLAGERSPQARSRGAYYRLLKQSRDKMEAVLYGVLLLEGIGFIDEAKREALQRLSRQVLVMRSGDIDEGTARDVTRILDEVVRRISRI